MKTINTDEYRFWSKVDVRSDNECWLWRLHTNECGYGTTRWHGAPSLAHRIVYKLVFGDPGDLEICHHCDTPSCCNLYHLFKGTHQDNMSDMVAKIRSGCQVGERNGNSRLNWSKVNDIRKMYRSGSTYTEIEIKFGIKGGQIYRIISNVSWIDPSYIYVKK